MYVFMYVTVYVCMYICMWYLGEVGCVIQVGALGDLALHDVVVLVDGLQLPIVSCMYVSMYEYVHRSVCMYVC